MFNWFGWNDFSHYVANNAGTIRVVVVVLLLTYIAQKLVVWWIQKRTEGTKKQTSIIVNLVRIGIVLLGVVFIFHAMNQPITPILTALGVGGLAVALGLQDTLANLFAGLNILASKKLNLGDVIELPNKRIGRVIDITWRHVILQDIESHAKIIVPNAYIVKEVIANYEEYPPTKEENILAEEKEKGKKK